MSEEVSSEQAGQAGDQEEAEFPFKEVQYQMSPIQHVPHVYASGADLKWNVYHVLMELNLLESQREGASVVNRTMANVHMSPTLALSLSLGLLAAMGLYSEQHGHIPIDPEVIEKLKASGGAERIKTMLTDILEDEF